MKEEGGLGQKRKRPKGSGDRLIRSVMEGSKTNTCFLLYVTIDSQNYRT